MTPQVAPRKATQLRMSEADLQACVIDLARACGWLVYHTPAVRVDGRWRTPTHGNIGYPDLTLCRPGMFPPGTLVDIALAKHVGPHIKFVELKSDRGNVSPEQQTWLDALFPYSCVWRPAQWRDGTIERALR